MNETIYSFWHMLDSKLPFNIVMAGISYCDKNYKIERSGENIFSFEYIIEGSGVLEIDSKTFYPQKNDVYLLTKDSHHKYYSNAENPWVKVWVVFNGDLAQFLFNQYLPADTYLVKDCNILSYMNEIINLASVKQKNYSELTDEISVIVLKIILHLKNHLENKVLSVPEQIKLCLDLNIENAMDINDVSLQLGYSKNYIIKLFRESYGLTPYSYFRKRKIELSKQYLLNTHLNINEISIKLNFADQHYFSGCFKAVVGMSPSEYRRNNKSQYIE